MTKISNEEMGKLYEDIYNLIRERFGTDEDGDLYIDVLLSNRTHQLPLHWFNLPYTWKLDDYDEIIRALGLAHSNAGIAQEQLRQVITALQLYEEENDG